MEGLLYCLCSVILFISVDFGFCTVVPPPMPGTEILPPFLKYGGEFCDEMRVCSDGNEKYPDKGCFCDELCYLMEDCCENIATYIPTKPETNFRKDQFSCARIPGLLQIVSSYGVLVVSKCSASWTDTQTRALCEGDDYMFDDNVILRTPVSDKDKILYRNMYCAYCNNEYDINFWIPKYICMNETDVRHIPGSPECVLNFNAPGQGYRKRLCPLIPPVSTCLLESDAELVDKCKNEPYFALYNDYDGSISYRNEYCAMCNGLDLESRVWCENVVVDLGPAPTTDPRAGKYSFRLLVDFNTRTVDVNGTMRSEQELRCEDNEIYDFLYDICREIVCVAPAMAAKGRCVLASNSANSSTERPSLDNCTWVKFTEGEYLINNDSAVLIISQQKVYTIWEYTINSTDVLVCLDKNQTCLHDCVRPGEKFNFDEAEGLLSMIGLIISIISLSVTFIIYVSFSQQLLNAPGKILLCLIIALWSAQLLFLISAEVASIPALCTVFAVTIHYFFLAAFCWMNVIAVDLWMTFSNTSRSSSSGKRLRMYHIYSWCIPLLIVGVAMVLDFANFDIAFPNLKPAYGDGVCWISSRDALLLFFIGPLALFKLVDIVAFIFTAYHIARAKRQGAMARRKNNTCSLLINIKLSLVMGLTWVFAFVANISNIPTLWYLFIIFNTLQGLFIALSFLCTKKVGRLLSDRYEVLTSSFSKATVSGTQLTNVSKST